MSLLLGYHFELPKINIGSRYKDNWNNDKCQQKNNPVTQVFIHKNINSIIMFSSKLYLILFSFWSFPKDDQLSKLEAYQESLDQ